MQNTDLVVDPSASWIWRHNIKMRDAYRYVCASECILRVLVGTKVTFATLRVLQAAWHKSKQMSRHMAATCSTQ